MTGLRRYSTLFSLWVWQGLAALIWLLLIPTDAGTYSAARLTLIGFVAVLIAASLLLALRARSKNGVGLSFPSWQYRFFYLLALLAFLLPPLVIVLLSALGRTVAFAYTAYAERLAPLASWASLAGLEWCLFHVVARRPDFSELRSLLASTLKILLLFSLVILIGFARGWGISPIRDGSFGSPPTPLLEWQIALAILLGIAALLTESRWRLKRLDVTLFFLVYVFTSLLWLGDPLIPGFFATPPRPPNFEPYPFSDPLIYAQYSQSALVGNGFLWPDVPTRPLYVMLLTWLYAVAGQSYVHVIVLQTLLLAFFPATLYLVGSELGSRPAGLMLALLAALRDITSNHVASFATNYSYSKLFLSEVPTALFLVVFTLLVIRWLKAPGPAWFFVLTGGVLGVASLTRLQSAVLLAPVALVTLFPLWKTRRLEWLRGLALMTLGLMLAFAPWLIRNYYAADGLVFDNPISQSMVFARRWSGDNTNTFFPRLPGETTAQYVQRMNGVAGESFRREPGRILNGIAHHFVNNLVSSLHTFPIRDRIESPAELLWPAHAFWQTRARSPGLSTIYLTLFAVGLAAAWASRRWIGLLPLAFSLAYNAWTAIFLSSGDRFLLPIDWTWHVYFVFGILALLKLALSGIQDFPRQPAGEWKVNAAEPGAPGWQRAALAAGLVLCVGALLPVTELLFPVKYPPLTRGQLSAGLGVAPLAGETLVYGRAVYPRYYEAGEGEPETAKIGYGPSAEARLVFWLVGPKPGLVILPLDTPPGFFPHASDVWIAGTMEGETLRARIVKVKEGERTEIYGP